jgi:hypothetical protein
MLILLIIEKECHEQEWKPSFGASKELCIEVNTDYTKSVFMPLKCTIASEHSSLKIIGIYKIKNMLLIVSNIHKCLKYSESVFQSLIICMNIQQ